MTGRSGGGSRWAQAAIHCGLCAAVLTLSACCTHQYPIAAYHKDVVDPAPTLLAQLDTLEKQCGDGSHAGYVTFGLCENGNTSFVWFLRRQTIHQTTWAYDRRTGARAYVEERGWSDVAFCMPDAVDVYGNEPPCHPVYQKACDALPELRRFAEGSP